jgi:hypothetical protein
MFGGRPRSMTRVDSRQIKILQSISEKPLSSQQYRIVDWNLPLSKEDLSINKSVLGIFFLKGSRLFDELTVQKKKLPDEEYAYETRLRTDHTIRLEDKTNWISKETWKA